MQILRAANYKVMPWKNGLGSTTEIAIFPANAKLDDFDWRVSMAQVTSDGPFSSFPGIDRTLLVIDGAGIGSAMTANKVPNVRAAACYSAALAKNSREHNGANVLTLGAGQSSFEQAKEIVEAFISTELSEERHMKRVGKIDNIEKQYRR